MKIILTLIAFVLFISDNNSISDLKIKELPTKEDVRKFNGSKGYKVYNSKNGIFYEIKNGNWNKETEFDFEIVRDEENRTYYSRPTNSIKVNNGWLIGFDRGEWGGALYWYNNDGTEKYLIKDRNVKDIVTIKNKIFITQGLAHLGGDFGSISKIVFQNDKWVVEKTNNLSGKPYKTIVFNDVLISITTEDIISIDSDMKLQTLYEKSFWRILYPNSIVTDKDNFYFGMRGGILKLNKTSGKPYWLTE
jgi:hypothetical protein